MSHPESSTARGSGGYKEPTIIKIIRDTIEEWKECNLKDKGLWECLHYEFEEFTEEQIATVPTPHLQYFRDFLQHRGVYVPRNDYLTLHESIYDTIHQQKPGRWPHYGILEHLETTGNFCSPKINRYILENDIPYSKLQFYKQTNPFLHPTPPPPITEKPPQSRTLTPTISNRTPTPTTPKTKNINTENNPRNQNDPDSRRA
jgi:hypothetical protein